MATVLVIRRRRAAGIDICRRVRDRRRRRFAHQEAVRLITIGVASQVQIGHALEPAVQCRRVCNHRRLGDEVVHRLAARRCSPRRSRGRSSCAVSSLLFRWLLLRLRLLALLLLLLLLLLRTSLLFLLRPLLRLVLRLVRPVLLLLLLPLAGLFS